MTRRLLTLLVYAALSVAAMAQVTVSRNYRDVPLPRVLTDLGAADTTYHFYFIHDELEDFRISCTLKKQTVPEALRTVIGFYPITLRYEKQNVFVECSQKMPHRLIGRIVNEQSRPLPYANITLLSPTDSSLLNKGVSNSNGWFVIPCEQEDALARVTHVGYNTLLRKCATSDAVTLRMARSTTPLTPVTISPSQGKRDVKVRKNYAKTAQKVCDDVWSMPMPDFEVTAPPEEYSSEPAVVIAEYDSLRFCHQPDFYFISPVPMMVNHFTMVQLHRIRIIVNSEEAVKALSTITFPRQHALLNKHSEVVGIKIIKPNGEQHFIDTTPYVQPTYLGEAPPLPNKIAVTGLEIGDIIDTFYYRESTDKAIPQYNYTFHYMRRYPVLKRKFRVRTDEKSYLRYRYLHQAPEFTIHNYANDECILRYNESFAEAAPDEKAAMLICAQDRRNIYTGILEKKGKGGAFADASIVPEWTERFPY